MMVETDENDLAALAVIPFARRRFNMLRAPGHCNELMAHGASRHRKIRSQILDGSRRATVRHTWRD
jgi:hypothetical protein